MRNKVVITGASHGIGLATAREFIRTGWYVIGIDKSSSTASSEYDRFIQADLSDIDSVKQIFELLSSKEKKINTLVNNAAIQLVKPLVETEPEEWDVLMAVNVRAAYLSTKYSQPLMRPKGGSIVNVASVHASATSKGLAAYATSKGALVAMTRAAALELAEFNIRVNAILPGAVNTEMLQAGLIRSTDKKDTNLTPLQMLSQKHPLNRIGQPKEIASAIIFLADEKKSSFITGQTLVVDGGATARLSTE